MLPLRHQRLTNHQPRRIQNLPGASEAVKTCSLMCGNDMSTGWETFDGCIAFKRRVLIEACGGNVGTQHAISVQ